MRLILASASPRRAELLRSVGYDFEVHAVEIDERPRNGEAPAEYVERLAREKADRAIEELSGPPELSGPVNLPGPPEGVQFRLVLGADTAVVIGDEILGKPHDVEDAARMLRRLSGRTHHVMTGICLRTGDRLLSQVVISSVTFALLTEDRIAWYVASGEGGDKAGGYAIQGLASRFIPRIDGSYSNVVGLPIAVVDDLIQRLTINPVVLASGE